MSEKWFECINEWIFEMTCVMSSLWDSMFHEGGCPIRFNCGKCVRGWNHVSFTRVRSHMFRALFLCDVCYWVFHRQPCERLRIVALKPLSILVEWEFDMHVFSLASGRRKRKSFDETSVMFGTIALSIFLMIKNI